MGSLLCTRFRTTEADEISKQNIVVMHWQRFVYKRVETVIKETSDWLLRVANYSKKWALDYVKYCQIEWNPDPRMVDRQHNLSDVDLTLHKYIVTRNKFMLHARMALVTHIKQYSHPELRDETMEAFKVALAHRGRALCTYQEKISNLRPFQVLR